MKRYDVRVAIELKVMIPVEAIDDSEAVEKVGQMKVEDLLKYTVDVSTIDIQKVWPSPDA